MRTVFTSIAPITNAYTNYQQLQEAKRQGAKRVYLLIEDLYVYERLRSQTQELTLKAHVQNLERFLSHLKLDYKIIYLSDVWERFFARQDLTKLFQKVLSQITFRDFKAYEETALFENTSLARMQYMVVSALTAIHFHELFPELSKANPTLYLAHQRTAPIYQTITKTLKQNYRKTKPIATHWTNPLVIANKEGQVASFDMPKKEIHALITKNINRERLNHIIHDFIECYESPKEGFYNYLQYLKDITIKPTEQHTIPAKYINTTEDFNVALKNLNEIKLKILPLCNGKHTSFEIARKLDLNPTTVAVYLGRLKKMKLISQERRPSLLVGTIVLDLESMR